MSDSFFGFDAALPGEDDDGGGGRAGRNRGVLGGGAGSGGRGSDSEEEYDALNDETFGQAREDDWENLHEDLVRMDQREGGDGDSGADSDLDINFSSVGIDNFELDNDTEPEARLQLDPSVWTMPSKPETPRHTVPPVSVPLQSSVIGSSTPVPAGSAAGDRFGAPLGRYPLPNPSQIRICSLEEIEQNMIKQQQEQMRRGMTPLPRPPPGFAPPSASQSQPMPPGPNPMLHRPVPVPLAFASPALLGGAGGVQSPLGFPPTNMPPPPPVAGQQQQQQGGVGGGGPFPFPITFQPPPPNNSNNSTNNNNNNNNASFSQRLVEEIQQNHPMLPHYRQPPPTGGLGQPPLPLGVPPGAPGPGSVLPPMPPPHGNFKHHPFMTPPPPHHHPHPPFPTPNWNGPPHHHNNMAHHHHHGHHNHPGHHHFPQQQMQHHHPGGGHHPHHMQQQHHQHHGGNMQQQQQQQQQGRGDRLQNGKLNRHFEYDEYANMMSDRAKHWLLGIQLSQLNKETAYYNDYYFCVFRDRKERERGAERESKAHKDNTFYHPFSQQMLHRNGLIRERRNSDNSSSAKDNIKEIQPRRYKPVQFENSLGKLQCGSVIAPRKIIDQDVVVDRSVAEGGAAGGASAGASGSGSGNNSSSDTAANQRRSRQVLLHVENLYRLVLRLEDMSNPLAIEAKQQMKEKRAKERLLAQQENRATDEQNNVAGGGGGGPSKQQHAAAGNVSEVEQDTIENLLERILPGLNAEGILRLLSVRKGKLLLKRIQKALSNHPARWTVWCTILATLVALPKRDREDAEDQLSPLFAQLELHVKYASAAELLPLFETLLNTDLLLGLVLKCKFLLLTVLTLIAQMEQLMTTGGLGGGSCAGVESINGNGVEGNDNNPQEVVLARWMTLLREVVRVLDTAAPSTGTKAQKVLLKLDSSCGIVKQLRAHLRRHQELDLERKLGALVAIIESSPAPSAKSTPATELPESGGNK